MGNVQWDQASSRSQRLKNSINYIVIRKVPSSTIHLLHNQLFAARKQQGEVLRLVGLHGGNLESPEVQWGFVGGGQAKTKRLEVVVVRPEGRRPREVNPLFFNCSV